MSKIKWGLNGLYYSGAAAVLSPFMGGMGAIFMLHHVTPGGGKQKGFAPNAGLEITPEFLDSVIHHVRKKGYETVSLDEAVERLRNPQKTKKRFVVFTLDDAPRDNYVHAWPIFKRLNCPFTTFAVSSFLDGTGILWWRAVEAAIAQNNVIRGHIEDYHFLMETRTIAEKKAAWKSLYWPIRRLDQQDQGQWAQDFAVAHGVDVSQQCQTLSMSWSELREMAGDPLCTVGGHTDHHYALGLMSREQATHELRSNRERLKTELNLPIAHFAYPYGDAISATPRDFKLAQEAGYQTAVTTRKGLLHKKHAQELLALPRLSLAGRYQKLRYIDVLLSGSVFNLMNRFRSELSPYG